MSDYQVDILLVSGEEVDASITMPEETLRALLGLAYDNLFDSADKEDQEVRWQVAHQQLSPARLAEAIEYLLTQPPGSVGAIFLRYNEEGSLRSIKPDAVGPLCQAKNAEDWLEQVKVNPSNTGLYIDLRFAGYLNPHTGAWQQEWPDTVVPIKEEA